MNSSLEFDIPDSPSQLYKFNKNRRLFFWWIFHRLTTPLRVLPDFLIIGVMKGGTTSLFHYLAKHPEIKPPFRKEIKFFDIHYGQGLNWYRAHFPLKAKMSIGTITGEATPYYIFHPLASERVAKAIPNVRLIAILRNPVDRGYSHYNHMVRVGREDLSFEDALEAEEKRLFQEDEKITSNPDYSTFMHLHYSYKARGRYVEQIKRWLGFFQRDQMLFLSSEKLYEQPSMVYDRATEFLGVSRWIPAEFKAFNQGGYDGLSGTARARLSDYFKPYNQELYELLNMDFGWD
jgi:hypothetical protein